MEKSAFHRLHLLVIFKLSHFKDRLKRLRAAEYPSDIAGMLIDNLLIDLDAQDQKLQRIVSDYSADPKGAFDRLRTENLKIIFHLPKLVALENAQTTRVPWSLVPGIERLARALMPDRNLLTTCGHDFNYMITWYRRTSAPIPELQKFHTLELPAIHRTNAFLHVLVGHELFHPLVDQFLVTQSPTVYARIKQPCQKLLQTATPHVAPLFDQKRLDKIIEMVAQIWREAITELMCDMGCAAIFGPAAVFALLNFALTLGFDEIALEAPFYPSFRHRLRVVLRWVFKEPPGKTAMEDLISALRSDPQVAEAAERLLQEWNFIEDEAAKDTDRQQVQQNELLKIAYDEIDRLLGDAWSFVQTHVGRIHPLQTWMVSCRDVPSHLKDFKMAVPSGELRLPGQIQGPPGSLAAISVAAWLHQLQQEPDRSTKSAAEILKEYERACGLLLKSWEDAELKHAFHEKQKRI